MLLAKCFVKSWWEIQHLPSVLLHYAELKQDMPGQIQRIADVLEIPIAPSRWSDILTHCSFDDMKQHAEQSVPLGSAFWEGGAKTFVHKGVNGRWKDLLSSEDIAHYEAVALEYLGQDCAQWLATGQISFS
jgi:aryl sulfotransferase